LFFEFLGKKTKKKISVFFDFALFLPCNQAKERQNHSFHDAFALFLPYSFY